MQRITVRVEYLRAAARELRQAATRMEAGVERAYASFERLDWEARRQTGVASQAAQARTLAQRLSADALALAAQLERAARAFEAADQQSTTALAGISIPAIVAAIIPWLPWPLPNLPFTRIAPVGETPADVGTPGGMYRPTIERREVPDLSVDGRTEAIPAIKPSLAMRTPFVSQLNTGWNNCGPAAYAMAIGAYGKEADLDQIIRDFPRENGIGSFGYVDSQGLAQGDLIESHILGPHDLHNEPVTLSDDLQNVREHLDIGHPVIIVIDNQHIIRQEGDRYVPYPYAGNVSNHIVVVTGVEVDAQGNVTSVTINDPLAPDPETGRNFRVPGADFIQAMQSVNPDFSSTSAVAVMPGKLE